MSVITLVNIRRMVAVTTENGTEYRKVSEAVVQEKVRRGTHILEGVDGDEPTNTVTYWYRKAVAGEDF